MQSSTRTLTILGATGSIGASTLDVVARHPGRYRVFALSAHRQADALVALCLRHAPRYAVLGEPAAAQAVRARLAAAGSTTEVLCGPAALEQVAAAPEVDTVMAAIVGAAGLGPAVAAARAGKRVLLANKESLVMAGEVFLRACRDGGATVLPIDSEHNAVFQCLPAGTRTGAAAAGVRRILLTASGGPFRRASAAEMALVTPEQACAHPNWSMGRKISVDSATMMNKGLEVIEAHWLFGAPREAIEVVLHPQSVVHSLVEYVDGSVLAQLGHPDMRTPIAQALAYPERVAAGVPQLDLAALAALSFEPPDVARFPCLGLAFDALAAGGSAPAILNAANEVAVEAFLAGRARFTDIAAACAAALERVSAAPVTTLEGALEADALGRAAARAALRLPREQGARAVRPDPTKAD